MGVGVTSAEAGHLHLSWVTRLYFFLSFLSSFSHLFFALLMCCCWRVDFAFEFRVRDSVEEEETKEAGEEVVVKDVAEAGNVIVDDAAVNNEAKAGNIVVVEDVGNIVLEDKGDAGDVVGAVLSPMIPWIEASTAAELKYMLE